MVSRGISICYQAEVLTVPQSSQEMQGYLRHEEMELSAFWKEN